MKKVILAGCFFQLFSFSLSADSGWHQQMLFNHETELRQIDEKFMTLEVIVDGLRKQASEDGQERKHQIQIIAHGLEAKVIDLETIFQELKTEVLQLKNQLQSYDKVLTQQNQNISHLQLALKALMEVVQGSEKQTASEIYEVKAGDNLEKIAQAHGTTVKAIKQINNLKNDRIRVKQKLKLTD